MMFFSNKNLHATVFLLASVIHGEVLFFGKDPGPVEYYPAPMQFKCVEGFCEKYKDGVFTIPEDVKGSVTVKCPHPPSNPYDRNYFNVVFERGDFLAASCSPKYDETFGSYHEYGYAFCYRDYNFKKGDKLTAFYFGKDKYSLPDGAICAFQVSSEEK